MVTVHINLQPVNIDLKKQGLPDTPDLCAAFKAGNFFYKQNGCQLVNNEETFIEARIVVAQAILDSKSEADTDALKAVFIGCLFLDFSAQDIALIEKEFGGRTKIIWGGIHPTLFPEQTLEDDAVDHVITGKGEEEIVSLMDELSGHRSRVTDFSLDDMSPPSWHLMDIERYMSDFMIGGRNYGKHMTIHTGRGCPHGCTFCINTINRQHSVLSARNIAREIRKLKSYKIRFVRFVDDCFFLDTGRIRELCGIIRRNR